MNLSGLLRDFFRAAGQAAKSFWLHNRFNDCAAISYYALLSIVPLVSLVVVVLSRVAGVSANEIERLLNDNGLLIPQFAEVFHAALVEMVRYRARIGLVSLVITIWFASLVFGSIQTAFDRIFQTFHPPLWGLMKPRLAALAAAVLLMFGFVFNMLASFVRGLASAWAGRMVEVFDRFTLFSSGGSFLLDMLVFMLILYTVPPRRLHDWRMVIPAALVGALGWRVARAGFAVYLTYASTRLTFSGSAGAAVIFLLWIYYAALVLLFSAELLAALDRARRAGPEAAAD